MEKTKTKHDEQLQGIVDWGNIARSSTSLCAQSEFNDETKGPICH